MGNDSGFNPPCDDPIPSDYGVHLLNCTSPGSSIPHENIRPLIESIERLSAENARLRDENAKLVSLTTMLNLHDPHPSPVVASFVVCPICKRLENK